MVDFPKPFKKGCMSIKVYFKHEQLQYLYIYICGCLGHVIPDYGDQDDDKDGDEKIHSNFGPFLWASPLKIP